MCAYLFVHFKEKRTPDGEQIYFGISKDGFVWETVNEGQPVLWSYFGDKGVRDHTIVRKVDGEFIIMATDLSLSYGMLNQYHGSWEEISRNGSKCLAMWRSRDLIHWSKQELVPMVDNNFGCVWAPEITYDSKNEEYIVHWSSSHKSNDFKGKAIYYSRTKDFQNFSAAQLLYKKEDSGVIDSCMYEENGTFYLFVKSEANPATIILLKSAAITGPFQRVQSFDEDMAKLKQGLYEAPTAFKATDGRWYLFLDFYGTKEAVGQGYVPFVTKSMESAHFIPANEKFSFPYGFKHGTILEITDEEFERLKSFRKSSSTY